MRPLHSTFARFLLLKQCIFCAYLVLTLLLDDDNIDAKYDV